MQKQAFKEQLAKETEVQPNEDEDARDAGISDETWANLQRAKEAARQKPTAPVLKGPSLITSPGISFFARTGG